MNLNKFIADICTPEHIEYQRKSLVVFKRVTEIFTANDIPYWLGYGTLVGSIRHGGFVPWDDDIDICISSKSLPVLKSICNKGLHLEQANTTLYRIKTSKSFIDVFVLPDNNGQYPRELYTNEIYPLKPGTFNGLPCFLPNDPTAFFLRRYGGVDPLPTCLIWNHKINDYWKDGFDFTKFVIPFADLDDRWKSYII